MDNLDKLKPLPEFYSTSLLADQMVKTERKMYRFIVERLNKAIDEESKTKRYEDIKVSMNLSGSAEEILVIERVIDRITEELKDGGWKVSYYKDQSVIKLTVTTEI